MFSLQFAVARPKRQSRKLFRVDRNIFSPAESIRTKIAKDTRNSTNLKAGLEQKIFVENLFTFRPAHFSHFGFIAQSGDEKTSVTLKQTRTEILTHEPCKLRAQMIDVTDIIVYQHARSCWWPGGRVVMQRFAKPCTSVQFRSGPPKYSLFKY